MEKETEIQAAEKQAPCEEPNVEPNPRTLGSQPEPKADAQPLSHPRVLPSCPVKKILFAYRTGLLSL